MRTIVLVTVLIMPAGCAPGGAPVSTPSATSQPVTQRLTPVTGLPQPVYGDQIGRLSPQEQRAVAAAKAAVSRRQSAAGFPVPDDAHLAFDISHTDSGWQVIVWSYNRDPKTGRLLFMPGGFTTVELSADWTVVRIVGGA